MLNEASGNNPSREQSVEAQVIEIMRTTLEQTLQVANEVEHPAESIYGQFNALVDKHLRSNPGATEINLQDPKEKNLRIAWITAIRQDWVARRKEANRDKAASPDTELVPEASAFNDLIDTHIKDNPHATDLDLRSLTSDKDKETYMSWAHLIIDNHLTSRKAVLGYPENAEKKEAQLKKIIEGKSVNIIPLRGADPEDVFEGQGENKLTGRVVDASALLGTLTVRTTLEDEATAHIFSNGDAVEQQAAIEVID